MKKIELTQIELIIGGVLKTPNPCSGTTGAFVTGFCVVGGLLNPVAAVGCAGISIYCAVK